MKIIERTQIVGIEVGDIVKGQSSGDHYLIVKQGNGNFNAVNLKGNYMLSGNGYQELSGLIHSSFDTTYVVKAKDITISLGGK